MTEQVEELTRGEALARVAVMEAKLADSHAREQALEDQVKELESRKFIRFNEDECWAWQGDGSDNLETLVCPVVIRPADLLAMLAAPAPVERVEQEAVQPKVARCIGMRPGMGEVTVKVEDGRVSGWLDPGSTVYIYPTPQPAAPAPGVAGLIEALEKVKRIAEHPPADRAILAVVTEALATNQRKEG